MVCVVTLHTFTAMGSCALVLLRFSRAFPGFEGSTGWKMTSDYEPMPADLRQELVELYRPFNEELFALLGKRYAWDS